MKHWNFNRNLSHTTINFCITTSNGDNYFNNANIPNGGQNYCTLYFDCRKVVAKQSCLSFNCVRANLWRSKTVYKGHKQIYSQIKLDYDMYNKIWKKRSGGTITLYARKRSETKRIFLHFLNNMYLLNVTLLDFLVFLLDLCYFSCWLYTIPWKFFLCQ